MLKVGDLIDLSIESLSYGGGRGVGRIENFVFFVPFTAPGDIVNVRVTKVKKNHGEAEVVQLLSKANCRVEPSCPVFGECGGCRFQHISYDEQLSQKNHYIQRALNRWESSIISPIVPSPREYHYRNRVQIHVRGEHYGYLRAKSDELVEIKGCPIAEEPIHQMLSQPNMGNLLRKKESKKIELFLDRENQVHLRPVHEVPTQLQFSQVNRFQNKKLILVVLDLLGEALTQSSSSPSRIYDLYAGSGNLTFPLYEAFGLQTVAVELSQISVQQGQSRLQEGQSIKFHAQDVFNFLNSEVKNPLWAQSVVVTDPPREGLTAKITNLFKQTRPLALVHIGCDLMSFSRDLGQLEEAGLQVKKITPLDMFPQTDHVELVALLT